MKRTYKLHKIVQRSSTDFVLYTCLENIADGRFAVHQREACSLSHRDYEPFMRESECLFMELFLQEDPSSRCDWFDNLSQAIQDHDESFSN